MFSLSFKYEDQSSRLKDATEKAAFRNFGHAAASIRKDVISTIEKQAGPSDPGTPPHTHAGGFLKRAIAYFADKLGAVVGPLHSVVGESGHAHEFGGYYLGTQFPERPFMYPALQRAIPRFAEDWKGSIGA